MGKFEILGITTRYGTLNSKYFRHFKYLFYFKYIIMKKIILSLAVVLFGLVSMAQESVYFRTMEETLEGYSTIQSLADMQALGNKFQMIANVEKTEWLPLYYHAHCYIILSFMEQGDAAKKDSYLDVAEKSIEKMIALAPNEAEVYALEAFYYSGRLVVDPAERGQKYSGLSGQAIGKALALDPTNPRANFIKLQSDKSSAKFFGKDPKSFCPQAKELMANWDNFIPKSSIYPAWGKEQLARIVSDCK